MGDTSVSIHKMEYHVSWDWLIPVVEKCFQEDGKHYVINDALLTTNIEEVYDAVVNFIRENTDTERMMKIRIADMDSDLN